MQKHIAIIIVFAFACATTNTPQPNSAGIEGPITGDPTVEPSTVGHSVPILEGDPAPFDGVLFDEIRTTQAIHDAAEVERLRVENSAQQNIQLLTEQVYESRIAEQRSELDQTRSWLKFAFPVGLVLGLGLGLLSAWGIYSTQ